MRKTKPIYTRERELSTMKDQLINLSEEKEVRDNFYKDVYNDYLDKRPHQNDELADLECLNHCRTLMKRYPQVAGDSAYWEKVSDIHDAHTSPEMMFLFTVGYIDLKMNEKFGVEPK